VTTVQKGVKQAADLRCLTGSRMVALANGHPIGRLRALGPGVRARRLRQPELLSQVLQAGAHLRAFRLARANGGVARRSRALGLVAQAFRRSNRRQDREAPSTPRRVATVPRLVGRTMESRARLTRARPSSERPSKQWSALVLQRRPTRSTAEVYRASSMS